MRIVFIGTVKLSHILLKKLIFLNANIVGVCTKESSNFNSDFYNLVPTCTQNNIPYKYVKDVNEKDTINWIRNRKADIIFCFGWSNLIKKELLELTKYGVIGYHPAKLPCNRGRHPLIWALTLGLKKSASTFFFMDEGADSGDILSQKEFEILYDDDASSLYTKMTVIAQEQIEEFLPMLENNTYKRVQQDHSLANHWRKRSKKDGLIDFRMTSNSIYNLVRALTKPYVGAHLTYNGVDISIWKVQEVKVLEENTEPGKVLESSNELLVIKTIDSAIKILEHDFKVLPKKGEYL